MVALLAMEPPVGPGVEELRDSKERVFDAIETLKPDDLVRGQFEGYRDEHGVAPDSDVETFAAVRLHIDSWRWAGVPVLPPSRQVPPVHLYRGAGRAAPAPDERVLRVRAAALRGELLPLPAQSARSASRPGSGSRPRGRASTARTWSCTSANDYPGGGRPYERLLTDALHGETLLFAREDGVEASWRVVDNVLTDHEPAYPYHRHTWGPEEQNRLIEDPAETWHEPVIDG